MIANVLIGLVALIHLHIVVLEMVLRDKPSGRRVFSTTAEFAIASKVLAANQGLCNGFLVAGLYAALTVGIKILFVQTVPAALAMAMAVAAILAKL